MSKKSLFLATLAYTLLISFPYISNLDFNKTNFETNSLDALANKLLKNGKMVNNLLNNRVAF
jgi:hypothetical protein